jgi:ATP-dependent helicase/nuclease subunit B
MTADDPPLPSVQTIPPGSPFVDALAAGLMAQYGTTPDKLAQVAVLLPTRRACRSLREAFLRLSDGTPLLLPRMTPLGDVDEDELSLSGWEEVGTENTFEAPEAVSSLKRQLLLTRLVMAFEKGQATIDQAARLAGELGVLLDQVQTERLTLDELNRLVPEDLNLSKHWEITLSFLKILTDLWPDALAEQGCVDAALRRNILLEAQAELWLSNPPNHPVIAAGSTGSIPATADLLKVVSQLPQGTVVLPGLDIDADDVTWQALEPSHPQFGMARLLEHFEIQREDVSLWQAPRIVETDPARSWLINRALLPAEATDLWKEKNAPDPSVLEGVAVVNCPGPQEEASAIALIMRRQLEEDGRTAALVTPDRGLARRVAAELSRWEIEVDDSAGIPLAQTPPGAFLRLTARMAEDGLSPVSLLAALKHPLASGGQITVAFRARIRELELAVLRGPRPGAGVDGISTALGSKRSEFENILSPLEKALQPFMDLLEGTHPLRDFLKAHIAMAEQLAATNTESGAAKLWVGEAGENAAGFVAELAEAAPDLDPIPGRSYAALLDTLMAGRAVRPRYGQHPRLNIWGLMEARMQHADIVILGGLNEGTWPPEAPANPWMSRPMLQTFGLPQPERRIGLTAHDFTQAFAAPEVIITRSVRVEGTPTVPSRWLLRLENLLGKTQAQQLNNNGAKWIHWQSLLDTPSLKTNILPPAPRPPVSARPRKLSVTQIETWMRDPYGVYARHILKLKALPVLDADPGAADYGTFIHEALDAFLQKFGNAVPADSYEHLLEMGKNAAAVHLKRPGVRAFWWPRFERIAAWFIVTEKARRRDLKSIASEVQGSHLIEAPAGPFCLTAKADRIDTLVDGTLSIIDYKTGAPPSAKEVAAGFAPQLPLEAVIAEAGDFTGLVKARVSALDYWRLTGGEPAGERKTAGKEIDDLVKATREGLQNLIHRFDFEDTPYEARPHPQHAPRYSDYEHLARVKEWSAITGGDE